MGENKDMVRLRDFSSAFSRRAFVDVLNFSDYSHFDWLSFQYAWPGCSTYLDLLKKSYAVISKEYPCEYVYKNELIKLLLKTYGTRNSVYFSEFRVGKSIADMVMFNGESKAFEIKTAYDTRRRLDKQVDDYKRFFDKCYVVVPEEKLQEYTGCVEPEMGIITFCQSQRHIILKESRPAVQLADFSADAFMSCLRTEEYKHIVLALGASLEGVAGYELYGYCKEVISRAEPAQLKCLFLQEVKKRNNNTAWLRSYPMVVRQMMLSLNLSRGKADKLLEKLNVNIKINPQ